MAREKSFVDNEIQTHKNDLNTWIGDIGTHAIPDSKKGVTDRFVRDCKTLVTDLESSDIPSRPDLVDFTDRRNSLEIQYTNLKEDLRS